MWLRQAQVLLFLNHTSTIADFQLTGDNTPSEREIRIHKYCANNRANASSTTIHFVHPERYRQHFCSISNRHAMKLSTIAFAILASVALAQEPAPASGFKLEKRASVSATVKVDGLRYRTCPKTSCSAPGQFPKGTKITLSCYTRDNTETINGDK
jgi:hypothetical protein